MAFWWPIVHFLSDVFRPKKRLLSFEGVALDKGSVLCGRAGNELRAGGRGREAGNELRAGGGSVLRGRACNELRAVSVASFCAGFNCLRLSAMIFVDCVADWHRCAYSASLRWARSPSSCRSARKVCSSTMSPSISSTEVPPMRCTSITALLATSSLSVSGVLRSLAPSRRTNSWISPSSAASMA